MTTTYKLHKSHFAGGKVSDSLAKLRRLKFSDMSVKSKKGIQPEMLPPTDGSAWQHSLRVFLQIILWKTLMATDIDSIKWGWQLKDGFLEPVMTLQVSIHLV